jgi:four helix bundle protein
MQTFRDMEVYRSSYELALQVYRLTKKFPRHEQYELARQLRRAATGIPLNVAEGFGRKSSQVDFANFVRIAVGSANEVMVLMDLCRDLGYVSNGDHERMTGRYLSLVKQLWNLMRTLKR